MTPSRTPPGSWYPQSRPRRVEGGIRARSKRGEIAQSWWSARFIRGLAEAGVGGRLARGRSYARAGQVLDLAVDAGSATALVQGSRPRPYRVRVGVTTFGKAGWAAVELALADNAWYTAKLLTGEMPTDIEDVFAAVGLALFPAGIHELAMDCTCPDHEVPCKHLAATLFLLAESFDADPFAILALRGRSREDLLDNLRARRGGVATAADRHGPAAGATPLADCLDSFFRAAPLPAAPPPAVTESDALLDQVPDPGVTVRGHDLVELLRPAYRTLGGPAG
ncbi:MAG: SWIM zinc finger family protein [Pseudonocardia sp.]